MNTLIAISIVGILALLTEIFRIRKGRYEAALVILVGIFVLNALDWDSGQRYFHGMLVFDNYAVAFSGLLTAITVLWFLMARRFFSIESDASEHFALVFFALAGGVIMTGYGNLTLLFLGIEILSISAYILAGSDKRNKRSNEAAMKYFLLGAFATGFLLLGIAMVYGATASFDLDQIRTWLGQHRENVPGLFYAGLTLLLAGLAFKVAAVPFHFWAPDVYDGSPTLVTAFMATLVKTSAFAAFYRLFVSCFALLHEQWAPVIALVSAATMIFGNLAAVYQQSLKRMLAFSSIAHAGYMLMVIVALGQSSQGALLFYAAAYSIASIGIFKVVQAMRKNEDIDNLQGYGKLNPVNAGLISLLVLSLAGIPPFAGFFAKYYVFLAAFQAGFQWLVIVAIISSLIGVYYYLKVIMTMYGGGVTSGKAFHASWSLRIILVISVLLLIWLGLFPGWIIDLL